VHAPAPQKTATDSTDSSLASTMAATPNPARRLFATPLLGRYKRRSTFTRPHSAWKPLCAGDATIAPDTTKRFPVTNLQFAWGRPTHGLQCGKVVRVLRCILNLPGLRRNASLEERVCVCTRVREYTARVCADVHH
jgi:hypothetical protein